VGPLPSANINQPGWALRQGQAIWKARASSPELAGELIMATRNNGESFVQFTKTPLPFVVARTTTNAWQIEFVPQNRTFSGPGQPPARLLWLHLPKCIVGHCDHKKIQLTRLPNGNQLLQNQSSHESIEFYFTPGASVYIVQAGDTLSEIALRQGVSLKRLETANPGIAPTRLQIGQRLNLPDSSIAP
jgi:hypothetical protein